MPDQVAPKNAVMTTIPGGDIGKTGLPDALGGDKLGAPARRELLLWARQWEAAPAAALLGKSAKQYDGQDHFYRAALNIAAGIDPARRDAILADFDKHFPEWNDRVADLVWELRPTVLELPSQLCRHPVTVTVRPLSELDCAVDGCVLCCAARVRLLSAAIPQAATMCFVMTICLLMHRSGDCRTRRTRVHDPIHALATSSVANRAV